MKKVYDEEIANVSANIPGTGVTPAGKPSNFGDPIMNPAAAKRWKKANQSGQGIIRRRLPNFAGAAVFEVAADVFHAARLEKRKHKTWRKYLEENECMSEIREFANKNPKTPIILQNERTGEMCYARYGNK